MLKLPGLAMPQYRSLAPSLMLALIACGGGATEPDASSLQILFTAAPDGNADIFAMTPDGATVKQLTKNPADDRGPRWSSDHRRIVFVTDRDTAFIAGQWRHTQEIYIMQADGSGLQRLTHDTIADDSPDWSPDDQKIVLMRGVYPTWSVFEINPDGTGLARLTDDGGDDADPRWSPGGGQIAFLSTRGGAARVYVVPAAGTTAPSPVPLPDQFSGLNVLSYSWAAGGDRIAFALETGTNAVNVFTISIAPGGSPTQLTNEANREDNSPVWSPDDSLIAFTTNRDNPSFAVDVIDAKAGTNRHALLTTLPSPYVWDWRRSP